MIDPDFHKKMDEVRAQALKLAPMVPGQLVIPVVPGKPPTKDVIKTYLTWNDVHPTTPAPSLDELRTLLREFNCNDILQSLSKLNVVFSRAYRGGEKLPPQLLKPFYEPTPFERILEFKRTHESVIPYKPAVIFLERLALLHSKSEGGDTVGQRPLDFGRLLLGATEYAEGPRFSDARVEGANDEERKEILAGSFFRNIMLHSQEFFGYQLARYWLLFSKYPAIVQKPLPREFFDLDAYYESTTGLTPELHVMFAFSIFGHYIRPGPTDVLNDPGKFPIGDTYFRNIRPEFHDRAKIFMGALSRTQAKFSEALAAERPIENAGGFDTRFIFQTPIFNTSAGIHFPLDLDLLGDQATKGLYWLGHDALRRASTDEYMRFKTWWGRLFEWHVRTILEGYLPDKSKLGKRLYIGDEDGFPGADFVIDDGDALVAIEVTTSGVPVTKIASGDGKAIFKSLELILFETEHRDKGKAAQLGDFMAGFRNGTIRVGDIDPSRIKTIYPVLLTEQGFPQFNPFIGIIRDEVQRRTSLKKDAVLLEFWDCEELEHMGKVIRSRASGAIMDKHRSGMGGFPMKNYLHKKKLLADNEYMRSSFHEFGELAHTTFFRKD